MWSFTAHVLLGYRKSWKLVIFHRIYIKKLEACTGGTRKWTMIALSQIEELCERIVNEFNPERVILFGSYAYGQPTEDSDVDLLVILPFSGRSIRKSLEIVNRVQPSFAVDVLARDPDDTKRRYQEWDPLIRKAMDRGRVLYESIGSRVDG